MDINDATFEQLMARAAQLYAARNGQPIAAAAQAVQASIQAGPPALPILAGMDTSHLRLAFVDEFDTMDWTKWGSVYPWNEATGRGSSIPPNDEKQWYINHAYAPTAGVVPWTVAGGELTITLDRTPPSLITQLGYDQDDLHNLGSYPFTSGLLHTRDTFTMTRGYVEMEALLPAGDGLWPAFWMLPHDKRNWDDTREIDVLETLAHEPGRIYTTVHIPGAPNLHVESWVDGAQYHRFGCWWDDKQIISFIDGKEQSGGRITTPPGFDTPMYLLLNLAVGGPDSWPGQVGHPVGPSTHFPAQLKVRSVKAWTFK
jgi:beta-glucanase (GH16 family)